MEFWIFKSNKLMFPIRIFSQRENPISLISISKFGYVKGWFWRTFPQICLNHPGNSEIDNKTSFQWVGLTDASDRDPRTAWSAHRSVRVGAIFFGFYWSWCGAVLKFQNFSGAAWCVDQPALVRGSLVLKSTFYLFGKKITSSKVDC